MAAEVLPYLLVKPKVEINGTWDTGDPPDAPTGGTDVTCFLHKVEFKPDEGSDDIETFCFTARSYKPVRLTVTLSVFQSWGTSGAFGAFGIIQGQTVPLKITADDTAGAADPGTPDNPIFYAKVHVPPMPFLAADVGEASDIDLDFDVQGQWYYDTTSGV